MLKQARRAFAPLGVLLCAATLVACGSAAPATPNTSGVSTPIAVIPPAPTPVAGAKCDVRYGNAPRPEVNSITGLLQLASLCTSLYGESLSFTDANGTLRSACLVSPPGTTLASPRPLLVWLHPSLFPIDSVLLTELPALLYSADLTGDATRPGYSLLLVSGRDTEHYYPFPDDTGLGWDNWYRNLDRTSPALNVDVATIDHFIAEVKSRQIVDPKRVYLSGWSNGSAMAELYGLNTPGIAAAAVYSSPNPFDDSTDPCPQAAFGNNKLALLHIGNHCDIIGICNSSAALLDDLETRGLAAPVERIRVNALLQEVQGCATEPSCLEPENPANVLQLTDIGTANHLRWPLGYTNRMLAFLKAHPLP